MKGEIMITMFRTFCKEEEGQDMVEYALLLAFVALAAVTVLGSVKAQIGSFWTTVNTQLGSANTAAS
jgi:Flp pilus assembly pilin Flp